MRVRQPSAAREWTAIGASVAMRSKAVCQDAHVVAFLGRDAVAIAVADGAGSASHAEFGAQTACHCAIEHIRGAFSGSARSEMTVLVGAALAAAREAVARKAEALGVSLRQLSTTLAVVLARGGDAVAAQVGDGMVVVEEFDGSIMALTVPMRGEYANQTLMLTSAGSLDQMQVTETVRPIRKIAAMTDGLLAVSTTLPHYRPFPAFFAGMFRKVELTEDREQEEARLRSFLASDRVQDGCGDDTTLVLAARTCPATRRTRSRRSRAQRGDGQR